jgi:hypothetical protein
MPAMATYHGSCHCGAVRFEIDADIATVMECNCSHCGKNGWLLAQVPAERFRLLNGEDALARYRFHKQRIDHLFCTTCGIHPFSRPAGQVTLYMVNARCLDDYDLDGEAPEIRQFDGRSL